MRNLFEFDKINLSFTDSGYIEFNLGKSINSQVRSVVLLKKDLANNVQDILADAER